VLLATPQLVCGISHAPGAGAAGNSRLARKVKPLCRFYEREMAAYALLRGIDYIYDECPYAEGSTSIYHKEVLNQMENVHPGTKLNFYLRFLTAREQGLFGDRRAGAQQLHACAECGQPNPPRASARLPDDRKIVLQPCP